MTGSTETRNYEGLSESQIFEKAKKELTPIQENLIEKKITIDDGFSVQYFTIDRATENFYVYAYRSNDRNH